MNILFEKDETVKELNLEQLKMTTSITDSGGKLPASRPIEHFQLIEEIQERLDKNMISYTADPIYVAKNDSGRIPVLDKEKTGVIESWVFPRLVTRLQLNFGNNNKYNPSIAIGYNLKGITIGMGVNTRICSNQSIFGNNLIQTWGKTSVAFEKVFNVLNDWLSRYDETFTRNVQLLDRMDGISLNQAEMHELIGELQVEAVKNAYINPGSNVPFNISQMSLFSKNLYNKHLSQSNDKITVSDFYNVGTDILKPKTTDIVDIWANNNIFSDYIVSRYGLNLN